MSKSDLSMTAHEINQPKSTRYGTDSSYQLAFTDEDFLTSHETRGIRFQLEITKPDMVLRQEKIKHTIVVFGSARYKSKEESQKIYDEITARYHTESELKHACLMLKNSVHYEKARRFGQLVAKRNLESDEHERIYVLTGGGPGIMEAANRGAFESGDKTIGMNIVLPFEQEPNPYITPKLCFDFHYFACRKFSFLSGGSSTLGPTLNPGEGFSKEHVIGGGGASALVCFAGGFGTLDEWFEALTLIQTGKMRPRPMILVGKEYWNNLIKMEYLAQEGVISEEDLKLFHIVDTPEEAWNIIQDFYVI